MSPAKQAGVIAELRERRIAAAEASLGSSSNAIYDSVERLILAAGIAGSVLDYGAGTGALTARLAASGRFRDVTGADLMPRPAALNPDAGWIEADLNEPLPAGDAAYEAVLAVEVIEHLENPRATARDLFRLVRPGGTLVLTTPNNESARSLLALLLRGHFVAFLDSSYPAHITPLLRRDIHRILVEAGFNAPRFLFTDSGCVPRFTSASWQRLSGGLLRGRLFSDNVLAITTRPK